MTAGKFISFEGGEGGGKSTQVARLAAALRDTGVALITTREPGGSPGAEAIRELLVTGDPGRWDALTEALLHFAARQDHLQAVIRPALAAGQWVLCDRFIDSTLAYQVHGRGLDAAIVHQLAAIVAADLRPDLTIILDLDPEVGLRRTRDRAGNQAEDRYERMDIAFHRRLRQGYLDIAAAAPERCVVVDAGADPDTVAAAIHGAVVDRCDPS